MSGAGQAALVGGSTALPRTNPAGNSANIKPMWKFSRSRGFTLIELLVAVVIVGIVAAIAVPSYSSYVLKSRRADAFDAVTFVQQEQERFRSQNTEYATGFDDLKIPSTSVASHYKLTLSDVSPRGYSVTAEPAAGGLQGKDHDCQVFKVVVFKGTAARSASSKDGADSTAKCWSQ